MRLPILAGLVAIAAPAVLAQAPPAGRPNAAASAGTLSVRRVVLYKTGVGYFEHRGPVVDSQDVAIRFTSAQLDDVLKSLTVLDLGAGRIAGISYNSAAPLDRRLGALRLPVRQQATLVDLLGALRGARVEIAAGGASVSGRLLSVERRRRGVDPNAVADIDTVSIVTDAGDLRTYDLDPSLRIRVAEGDLRRDIAQYLDLVGAAREQDVRRMVVRTAGSGTRDLFVSYISEVPVWKTTYRLVLPERGAPLLQGWAIVDNTTGEDWTGVQMSLVAGAPQTFVQQISQPYYTRRPVVPLPRTALLTPQTHAGTLESGPGTIAGTVRDAAGAALPGVQVVAGDGTRRATATTDVRGEYRLTVPAGTYQVEFSLPGFAPLTVGGVSLGGGVTRQQDATMMVGRLQEAVTLSGETPESVRARRGGGIGGGVVGGVAGGIDRIVGALPEAPPAQPAPQVADALRAAQPAAAAADLGDLFEYRITSPVTIAKDESALVPILNADVTAEKVSLWTRASGSGRPLRAVWLTNTSGLTLDGGSFSVVDGEAFGGEGVMEPLQPGERRLLSYAADLGVLVAADAGRSASRIVRLRGRDGILIEEVEERTTAVYKIRNEDAAPRTVVVEHPIRSRWRLAAGVEPAEQSPQAYRFRVGVEPRQEVTVEVPERRTAESRVAIGELDESRIEIWEQSGLAAADLERALRPVLEQRRAVAALDDRLARLEAERQTIVADQERLRENLKTLGRSPEERRLVQRYTGQLDQQEDRLEAVARDLARVTDERDRAQQELARLIGGVSFDVATAKG